MLADWVIALISLVAAAFVVLIIASIVVFFKYKVSFSFHIIYLLVHLPLQYTITYKQKIHAMAIDAEARLKKLLEGDPEAIDPDRPLDEQTQHLPYDNQWEFSRDQLYNLVN